MHAQSMNVSSAEDLSLLFCGERFCSPGHTFGPAVRQYYMLYYCVSGHAIFQTNQKNYSVGPQHGFLVWPGEVTFGQANLSDPCHCIWIAFSGTAVKTTLAHIGLSKTERIFCCGKMDELLDCLHQMVKHTKLSYSDEFYLQSLLYRWFALLASAAALPYHQEKSIQKTGNVYVTKAVEYMRRNCQNSISISELAEYVGLNRCYLTSLFQRYLHTSPRGFLIHLRIDQATKLLCNSQLPVGQIAHSCGYSDPLAFSKAFHKLKGCSPSEYRAASRQKISKHT